MTEFLLEIPPMAAPRLPNKMRFSPQGKKYFAWKNSLAWHAKIANYEVWPGDSITFFVGARKRGPQSGPHQVRPDLDNYLKAFLDALCEDDAHIWEISARKAWSDLGYIFVERG